MWLCWDGALVIITHVLASWQCYLRISDASLSPFVSVARVLFRLWKWQIAPFVYDRRRREPLQRCISLLSHKWKFIHVKFGKPYFYFRLIFCNRTKYVHRVQLIPRARLFGLHGLTSKYYILYIYICDFKLWKLGILNHTNIVFYKKNRTPV